MYFKNRILVLQDEEFGDWLHNNVKEFNITEL